MTAHTTVSDPSNTIAPARREAVFIGAGRYRHHSYGSNHPLGIPRVSLTRDLIDAYGALADGEFLQARKAVDSELHGFHTPAYISALKRCEALGKVTDRYRKAHNLGNFENPWFPGFFTTPATATGSSVQGAEQLLAGRMAFNPAGGMHHAAPDQARGFCYLNDPVLGIQRLRRDGLRVLYLDIDAHHGDGVEAAFADDPAVVTCSLHMDTDYAYPFRGGAIGDTGPLHNAVNLPLPKATNDTEFAHAFDTLWPRVLAATGADAVVLQTGTDILRPDPLGKFAISTQRFLATVDTVIETSPRHASGVPRLLALGGGGYHPLVLARCWAGVWALLSGRELPEALPETARDHLRAVDWDMDEDEDYFEALFETRLDPDLRGPLRPEVERRVEELIGGHPLLQPQEG